MPALSTTHELDQSALDDKVPRIYTVDDVPPEDLAMLQALYSRSPASVTTHLDKVRAAGSSKFMSQYYVGYGHASIGDCGFTTVFIENYSMLACKAIQDTQLYNGQEASTRYLDFSIQPVVDPYDHPASRAIQDAWMALYNKWLPVVKEKVALQRPYDAHDYKSEKIWMNAVTARAFDVMRGFLPVGTSTLLSWSTNLRQARDRLMQLKHHPLPEIQQLAKDIFAQLHEKYPNSFNGNEMTAGEGRYAERDDYGRSTAIRDHYQSLHDLCCQHNLSPAELALMRDGHILVRTNTIDIHGLNKVESDMLAARPRNAALPRRLASYGSYNLIFAMDFGSYRDLQRHRGGHCQLPLIDGSFGFSSWYLDALRKLLDPDQFTEMQAALQGQLDAIAALEQAGLKTDSLMDQYLYPMGMLVPVMLTYSVPQMVYVAELRSLKTVHGSLRPVAQQMAHILAENHPGIALYADMDAEDWTSKRGEQTITAKS